MKKNIIQIVAGIFVLAILLLWQLFANLDNIVAGTIEDVGSDVLKTDVSVSGVSIDLTGGKAKIAGMTIANPEGYSDGNLFELNNIAVTLDLDSLNEDVLVIKSIQIQDPQINFEGDADGGSNMQTLLDNINSGSSGNSKAKDEGDSDEGEHKRMIINTFELRGAQVNAITKLKPGEPTQINLPPIKMSGIGKNQGGVTADVVAKEITLEMIGTTLNAAAKAGIKSAIEKKSKGFFDKLKGKG
jgi:hypothetical protein